VRLQDHYDWIVLGEQPAALLTASMVARLGLSVLVLPLAPGMNFSVSPSGQCFDPESNSIVGLGELGPNKGLITECLTKLGVLSAEEFYKNTYSSHPQILTPESRYFLSSDDSILSSEIQRELGTHEKMGEILASLKSVENEYLAFWQALPKKLAASLGTKTLNADTLALKELQKHFKKIQAKHHGFVPQKWGVTKRVSDFEQALKSSDLLSVSEGLWYWVTSCNQKDPRISDLVHIWSLSRVSGAFKGGLTAYREFLVNLAVRLGAHVPVKTECKRIFVEKGRFAGVQIANRGNMILTQGGIIGCPLSKVHDNLIYTGRKWLHRKKKGPVPVGWKFTLAMTVHKESIPIGISNRLIWQEQNAPVFEVEIADLEDYKVDYHVGGSSHKVLYLRTVMPFSLESLDSDFQRLTAARMVRQAMEIMPFLEYHVTRLYPEFRGSGKQRALFHMPNETETPSKEEVESQSQLQELYGFEKLENIPSNLFVYDPKVKGVGPHSGIEGLFVASEESYPALGGFGATVAAFESVATLVQRMGLGASLI
jgi:hypothetical protein